MSIIVELYKSSVWNDISDYITKASPVPYIERNRDWSPMSTSFNCSISISVPYVLLLNDPVRVKYNSTVIFAGYITRSPENYDTREYEVEVTNDLYKLTKYLVEYSTLHTQLASSSVYPNYNVDYNSIPRVYVLWLLKSMFTVAGLTLNTTAVDDVTTTNEITPGTPISVPYKAFYIREAELWCLNQGVAVDHTIIDSLNYDYVKNKITFYDLFLEILSAFGFGIYITNVSNYKLIQPTSNYSPSDDAKYSYKSEPLNPQYTDAEVNWNIWGVNYSDYTSTTPYTNPAGAQPDGKGKNILSWLSNLQILFSNPLDGSTAYSTQGLRPYASNSNTNGGVTIINPAKNKFAAVCVSYTEETIKTDINITPLTVVKNYVNIQDQTSEIIQETY